MAEISRYSGNLKPFAKDALGTERTVFGDTSQSDAIDDNINADFFRGWGIVGVNELPTKQDFNALAYTSTALTSYIYQRGIPAFHADQEFFEGSITFEDGLLYKAVQDNTGNLPSDDNGTNWNEFLGFTTYDAVTTYHEDSIVRKAGTSELYSSIADGNVGNALPAAVTDSNWTYLGDLSDLSNISGGEFTESFTSTDQTITSAGSLTIAHGLTATPKLLQLELVAQGSFNGYSLNDVLLANNHIQDGASGSKGFSVVADSTNLNVRFGSSTPCFDVLDKSSGNTANPSNSSFKLRIKAWA
jgi:hypothetical protein